MMLLIPRHSFPYLMCCSRPTFIRSFPTHLRSSTLHSVSLSGIRYRVAVFGFSRRWLYSFSIPFVEASPTFQYCRYSVFHSFLPLAVYCWCCVFVTLLRFHSFVVCLDSIFIPSMPHLVLLLSTFRFTFDAAFLSFDFRFICWSDSCLICYGPSSRPVWFDLSWSSPSPANLPPDLPTLPPSRPQCVIPVTLPLLHSLHSHSCSLWWCLLTSPFLVMRCCSSISFVPSVGPGWCSWWVSFQWYSIPWWWCCCSMTLMFIRHGVLVFHVR